MLVIDTNIVVRLITADDASGSERAWTLISQNETLLSATVMLETAWVLSRRYGVSARDVARALRRFAGLPLVTVEASADVHRALAWAEEGMDVADAFHLALNNARGTFATFDQDLLRQARARGVAVVEP